ncbi:MAG: aldolase/citrate lyase family protein [Acidobacteriota bacterium]|nr:aldolase/citrate lyase family protein [Acidobacteriota bacterium]
MNRLRKAVEQNNGQTLLGAALYFYDPIFLDVAAQLGYQVIWIEMEHAHITFAEAADLCRMASGSGMLTMIRVPDSRRENILKAAECGPDIIDVSMVDEVWQMNEMLQYARFAPVGRRGYFGVSRAVDYGVNNHVNEIQQNLNQELCLLAQVETQQSLQNLDQLAAVPGVDLFVGPADLAASLGYPGDTLHPAVCEAATRVVKAARANNKCIATACAPSDFKFWLDQRIDLLFCTNDITSLKRGASLALDEARALLPPLHTVAESGSANNGNQIAGVIGDAVTVKA